MLVLNGIKDLIIPVKNPQANAICERLHQSISNSLQVRIKAHPPINEFQAQNILDVCFAAASYAARANIHSILVRMSHNFVKAYKCKQKKLS